MQHYGGFLPTHVGPIQYIARKRDLKSIRYYDGVAALEVPWSVVRQITFRNDWRPDSPRLQAVVRSIREKGFQPFEPIICRIGRKGKWFVIDGGHRLTAARIVDGGFFSNLFSRKVRTLYFLVFEKPRRWPKVRKAAGEASDSGGRASFTNPQNPAP